MMQCTWEDGKLVLASTKNDEIQQLRKQVLNATEVIGFLDAEKAELSLQIEQLREALEDECGNRCNAEYNPCWARQALNTTPNADEWIKRSELELVGSCEAIVDDCVLKHIARMMPVTTGLYRIKETK